MGTSLFNTTPAATYPALIKVGNNTSIDGTLKVLSDGAGNDLPLQVSSTVTNFTGNVGINTTTPTQKLDVNGVSRFRDTLNIDNNKGLGFSYSGGSTGFNILNSSSNQFQINNANYGYNLITIPDSASSTAAVGIGTTSPTAKLQVKGNGSTSATTSLLVQNSDGNTSLSVLDNQNVGVGATASSTLKLNVVGAAADGVIRVAGPHSEIQLRNKNSAYNVGDWKPAIYFLENGVFESQIAYSGSYFEFGAGITAGAIFGSSLTSNNGTLDLFGAGQTINFTDMAFGVVRGAISMPNILTPFGYGMNISVNSGDMSLITGAGSTRLTIKQAGNVGIGATDPTARLQVQGSGTTSATTALLITNGAATPANLFSVTDDGKVTVKGNIDSIDSTITVRAATSLALTLTASQTTIGNHTAFTNGALDDLVNGNYFFRHSTSGNTFDFRDPTRVFLTTSNSGTIIQNTSFGGTAIAASALLEVQSTTKGFLPPRMTTAERVAISSPANGLIVFDTDVQNLCYRRDSTWVQVSFTAV
jgi:hypothetical protein